MPLTNKEILFFILAFMVMFMMNNAALYLNGKFKWNTNGVIPVMVATQLATIVLLVVYKVGNVAECGEEFLFEVSKPKQCQGGWYMRQGEENKELNEYCKKLMSTPEGRREYSQMNCTLPGFVGRPVTFNRTPMSDALWENKMRDAPPTTADELCNNTVCTNKEFQPCVL